MGHRLRRTAQRLTGLPDRRIGLSLFANEATVNGLIWRGGAGSQPWKVGGWVLPLGKAALPKTARHLLSWGCSCQGGGGMLSRLAQTDACQRPGRRGSQPTLAFRSPPPRFHGALQASLELLQAELVVVGMDKDAADLAMRCELLHLFHSVLQSTLL